VVNSHATSNPAISDEKKGKTRIKTESLSASIYFCFDFFYFGTQQEPSKASSSIIFNIRYELIKRTNPAVNDTM